MGRLGWYSPINQKMTKSWPIRFPSTKFLHPTHKSLTLLCLIIEDGQGGESNCIFWNFSPPKAFCYDAPKLRNFRESPTLLFIITLHFMKLLGKTFKCKMKIMGENQMRKLQWTQTIIIILLIQTEQIPTSEQNNQWICKLKKSLNQRRS